MEDGWQHMTLRVTFKHVHGFCWSERNWLLRDWLQKIDAGRWLFQGKRSLPKNENVIPNQTFFCEKREKNALERIVIVWTQGYLWPWTTKPVIKVNYEIYTSSEIWINKLSIDVWFVRIGQYLAIWIFGIWRCNKIKRSRKSPLKLSKLSP